MTLSSRHSIQHLSPDCLRLSTLPLGHRGFPQYYMFKSEPAIFRFSKQAALSTVSGPPPYHCFKQQLDKSIQTTIRPSILLIKYTIMHTNIHKGWNQ